MLGLGGNEREEEEEEAEGGKAICQHHPSLEQHTAAGQEIEREKWGPVATLFWAIRCSENIRGGSIDPE